MPNNIVTLDQFDALFADFVQSQLGLEDDEVRISFQEFGQKSSPFSKNVVYVKTEQENNEISKYKNRFKGFDSTTNSVVIEQQAMRVISLWRTFYGPNSQYNQMLLYEKLFTEGCKEFFYKNNLALIPDMVETTKTFYENINGRWWNRADMNIRFYNSVSVEEIVETIENPNIIIKTNLEVNT